MKNIQKFRLEMVKEAGFRYDYKGDNPTDVGRVLIDMGYDRRPVETMGLVCLDTKLRIIGLFEISTGDISQTFAPMRSIFQRALLCNAASIILWHNHPSGDLTPSSDDVSTAFRTQDCANLMGIKLQDCLIIGDGATYSMRERGDF